MRARSFPWMALTAAAVLLAACGGPPDPPEFFGVYLWDGGHLVRLEARQMSDTAMRNLETGVATPLPRQSRADLLSYPTIEDDSPTLYVYFDNCSALSAQFQRYGVDQRVPSNIYPLIAPVEDHPNLYRVQYPDRSSEGQYEVLLPNDLICGFLLKPEK